MSRNECDTFFGVTSLPMLKNGFIYAGKSPRSKYVIYIDIFENGSRKISIRTWDLINDERTLT